MRELFWLGDGAWAAIEPHLPKNQSGARRVDGRRVISGIIHVLKKRLSLEGLPSRIRSSDDGLQPLQPLVTATTLVKYSYGAVGGAMDHHRRGNGRQLREGAPMRPRRKRGAKNQAIGFSRGGQTTKIHALSDTLGRPFVTKVTAGNVSDINMADALLAEVENCRYDLADKGYDSDKLRKVIRDKGARPVIPGRKSRKRKIHYDKNRYKSRWMIEAVFCRLKDFRRVATGYDKLARNYMSHWRLQP